MLSSKLFPKYLSHNPNILANINPVAPPFHSINIFLALLSHLLQYFENESKPGL